MANRLQGEKSPYLLQHKDNPVDWYPWGAEAFERAKRENKPIFLSIGYSTCHWCHVMARESFEDETVAELLNEYYICIKVDREERPDIDAVYMEVCQLMTGAGGWPLTVLMTPGQKPFFAATYLPKTGAYGRMGLMELLEQIAELWESQNETVLASGERIAATLQQPQVARSGDMSRTLWHKAFQNFRRSFDARYGGFGTAPKFPAPHNLLFLMHYAEREHCPEALDMAEKTLRSMAAGGIFDHIGGGFSRYSTDEQWLCPHFEKMLYDNALLLLAYTEAYQRTQKAEYADVIYRTADYVLREMTHPEGGFFSAQDADSGGVEGGYYTLTRAEICGVLGAEDGESFCRSYAVRGEGKCIPNRIGLETEPWDRDDARLQKLLDYRRKRFALGRDEKILLSRNGWMMLALTRAGMALRESRWLNAAQKAQLFAETHMTDGENRLFARWRDGDVAHEGQLDDYAVYALALLGLYRATLDVSYLEQAIFRAEQMDALFADREHGGYFRTASDAPKLISRPKEFYDGAMPSGNSAAAMVLTELAALTGETVWREAAERQLRAMAGQSYPQGSCYGLLAAEKVLYPSRELVVCGDRVPDALSDYLAKHPADGLTVLWKSHQNAERLAACAPFTADYGVPAVGELWYLCENGACRAPVTSFAELKLP